MGAEASIDIGALLFGKSVRGVIEGDSVPDRFIPQLIQLYRDGRFPFDRLIQVYPLADIDAAARDSEEGGTLKPVLRPAT
jgi:aryl-alcohol dehydrogenase